ncbi:MAG: hypothetical protein M5U34_40105 [Chloroflexi bacterium]|nr:hypothetical protein [Chloroflexota bacterium]
MILLPFLIEREQMAVVGLTIAALGVVNLVAAFIQRRSAKRARSFSNSLIPRLMRNGETAVL